MMNLTFLFFYFLFILFLVFILIFFILDPDKGYDVILVMVTSHKTM